MGDQIGRNDERCREWCTFLETLRQNPGNLPSSVSSDDLKFGADSAALPPAVVLAAAAHFGVNLRTGTGILLLSCILADIIFRPERPVKRGRPSGTVKWDQRKLSNLGFRAACIKANNPRLGYEGLAGDLIKKFKDYQHVSPSHLRQRLPKALRAYKDKVNALGALSSRRIK
jgi:hypothetical protein